MSEPVALTDLQALAREAVNDHALVPPPRFAAKRFADYQIDERIAGQADAVARVRSFAEQPRRRWWHWHRRDERPGLYLDGGFGVGKTHLLAAAYHACPQQARYCSFAEAISLAIVHGNAQAIDRLAADLLCIDEFELDDPSNTRLADLLLEGLQRRGCRIITTSNTVPGELGEGRMAVDRFRNQLVRIADVFEDVHIPGTDHRQIAHRLDHEDPPRWRRDAEPAPLEGRVLRCRQNELDQLLRSVPIIKLATLAAAIDGLHIVAVTPFPDQLSALRFVHFIDSCYDHCVALAVQADCPISELFLPEYRDWAFAKKYRRCQSRLVELCSEAPQGEGR